MPLQRCVRLHSGAVTIETLTHSAKIEGIDVYKMTLTWLMGRRSQATICQNFGLLRKPRSTPTIILEPGYGCHLQEYPPEDKARRQR